MIEIVNAFDDKKANSVYIVSYENA